MKLKFIILISLFLCSCKIRTIHRNYEYSPNKECDCTLKSPLILVGSGSVYKIKNKAKCTRISYKVSRDSINILEDKKYKLIEIEDFNENDSLKNEVAKIDSILKIKNNQWTHCKIKVIYKRRRIGPNEKDTIVSLSKQTIIFYNNNRLFRKKMMTEKHTNGQVLKTKK
jgi:hypothetical protein